MIIIAKSRLLMPKARHFRNNCMRKFGFAKPYSLLQRLILAVLVPLLIALCLLPARNMATTTDVAMLQLLWVTWVAQYVGQRWAIMCTLVSVVLLNLVFVEPYYTLLVHQGDYLVTFLVMLLLGIFIARLSGRLRIELARTKKNLRQRQRLIGQARQAKMRAELEHNRAMMLRSLSHDLRTPLATIMGASSMLADPELALTPEQIRQQAQNIYSQSHLLSQHFDKVMELSRVQQMQRSVSLATHTLSDIVAAAIARRGLLLSDYPCVMQFSDTHCVADATLLEIALANLLENAVKYGVPPLSLEFTVAEGYYHLTVSNALVSMISSPTVVLPPNHTYRSSPVQRDSSSGLGTAICNAVMQLHQGRFSAQHAANDTLFVATLSWPQHATHI